MRLPPFGREFLLLFGAPLVWAAHFVAVYGFTGVVCARWPQQPPQWLGASVLAWGVVGLGVLAAAGCGLVLWRARLRPREQGRRTFIPWVAAGLAWLALLAVLLETLTVFIVPACSTVA